MSTYRGVQQSMSLWERAQTLIPGGTQLVSRRPTRFACGVSPVYAASASGARFTDVDGNEFIDWVSGIGAIILGYADPVVDSAVIEQIHRGTMYSINHELELELAEELVRRIPCAEMVRYAKGGGEACAMAVRIARGVTGRDSILFCGYHGWHDWYLAANLDRAALDAHLFPGIDPIGVPEALRGTAIPFPYGELDALGELLEQHRGKVAAVMMEPLRSEMPPEGYLEGVRQLADEHHVVLIFDEVSTGFRLSEGGTQPVTGVIPDMAVFAKSISNGYPMGAVVGRREVMAEAARMFISSTYWSDTIGLRAALTTLREVSHRAVPDHVQSVGRELMRRLNEVARASGLPVECGGVDVHPSLRFDLPLEDDTAEARQARDAQQRSLIVLYIQEMARRGCHGYSSFYLNGAQSRAEIDQTVDAAREVFPFLAEVLQAGRIEQALQAPVLDEPFRRLVR